MAWIAHPAHGSAESMPAVFRRLEGHCIARKTARQRPALRKGREGFELKMSQGCKEILQIVKTSIQGLNGKHVRESFGLELYASLQGFCVQGGEHPSGLTGDQLFACPSAKIVVRPPMIIFCAGNKLS
jgi:hypothetical protein